MRKRKRSKIKKRKLNNQNLIYDIKDITEGAVTEPVTVQNVKDYLRMEGFVDDDESTTESLSNFTFDDTLISTMITAARKKMEAWCGVSIVDHTWKVMFKNEAGDFEYPYGPVQAFTSLAYKDGTAVGSSAIYNYGYDFWHLESPNADKMTAIYEAGYEDCPEELELAILQCVAHWYENRVVAEIPGIAKATASTYKRPWTWLA